MQQKQSQILEMQVELRSVKDRAAELQEQLNSERMMGAELKNELAQAKLELETTLKAQHKHFKDLETIRYGFQYQPFSADSEDDICLLSPQVIILILLRELISCIVTASQFFCRACLTENRLMFHWTKKKSSID